MNSAGRTQTASRFEDDPLLGIASGVGSDVVSFAGDLMTKTYSTLEAAKMSGRENPTP